MRLIFVNRFYWPETPATGQLLTDLAEALAAEGHEVTVVTSGPASAEKQETRANVRIHRLRTTRSSHRHVLGKALDFATFYFRAILRVYRLGRRDTTVIALTDPPLIGVGLWLVTRLRGGRIIHWIQDIYPELAMELAGAWWLRAVRPLRNAAWRGAERCVTLGGDMRQCLAAAHVPENKCAVISNWSPAGVAPSSAEPAQRLRATWRLTEKFVVAYSGNLGRVHDLLPVLDVADALRACPNIAFVFIGDGAQRSLLETESVRRGLQNISFRPPQPRGQLAETLTAGDLHLVTLRPGCERFVFPSKLYGIVAVGRPVFFIGPPECDIAHIIKTHGIGLTAERQEVNAIAKSIRELAADGAALFRFQSAAARFATQSTLDHAVAKWSALLAAVETSRVRHEVAPSSV